MFSTGLLSENFTVSLSKVFLPWQCFISTSSLVLSTYNARLKLWPQINFPKTNPSKEKGFQEIWFYMSLIENEEVVNVSIFAVQFTYAFRITNPRSVLNPQKIGYHVDGSDELGSLTKVMESGLWDTHPREDNEDVMERERVTKGLARASILAMTRSRIVHDILFHGEKRISNNQKLILSAFTNKNLCYKSMVTDPCVSISSFKERLFPHSFSVESFLQVYNTLDCFLNSKTRVVKTPTTIPHSEVSFLHKNTIISLYFSTVGVQLPSGNNK